jgi:hypothetical protein
MKKSYYKTKFSTIALILVLTISATTIIAMPITTAQESRKSYPFLGAVPNPVGVNQPVLFHVGIFQQLSNVGQGWDDLSIIIEKPDGQTETIPNIRTDSTGGTGVMYTPTMTGTYYCHTHFPEQVTTEDKQIPREPLGIVILEGESEVVELVVQDVAISYYPGQPLPSEYWTRPIDAQLREWSVVSGSWLWAAARGPRAVTGNDEAPESAHILWTKPLTWGGQAGGTMGDWSFSHGDAYEGKWDSRIIIDGILVYCHRASRGGDLPLYYIAVDLRTGEELWTKTLSSPEEDNLGILFGQNLKWAGYNHHAIYPYIWATRYFGRSLGGAPGGVGDDWYAINPYTGDWEFTVENVPSGTTVFDETNGWIYRVNLDWNTGEGYVWSMTDLIVPFGEDSPRPGSWGPAGNNYGSRGSGTRLAGRYETWDAAEVNETTGELTEDAQRAYIAKFTFPTDLPGGGRAVRATGFGDRPQYTDVWSGKIFGLQYSYTEVDTWAISLESGREGTLLFNKTWNAPPEWAEGQPVIEYQTTSLKDGASVLFAKWERLHYAFSTENGEFLWNTDEPEYYMNLYGLSAFGERPFLIWDGKFYTSGAGGYVYCYDLTDGHIIWKYIADDPYQEYLFANQWWQYILFITDGKIYLNHVEHSAIEPMPRGAPWLVLDATTGDEIARADGLFRGTHWGGMAIIGDSVIAHYDTYDLRVYAIGKGPSATTVFIQNDVISLGSDAMIKGNVLDVSPGTEDTQIKLRFPYGVPAVSDESQSEWMQYVYKQLKSPDEATVRPYATGVTVKIEVVNPNNEYEMLGTTTSDTYGNWAYSFKPDVEGIYMIIATFEGSKSYYGSTETTYLKVGPAPSPEQPIEPEEPEPEPEAPLITTEIAIILAIVAVAVIGIVGYWVLKKRK